MLLWYADHTELRAGEEAARGIGPEGPSPPPLRAGCPEATWVPGDFSCETTVTHAPSPALPRLVPPPSQKPQPLELSVAGRTYKLKSSCPSLDVTFCGLPSYVHNENYFFPPVNLLNLTRGPGKEREGWGETFSLPTPPAAPVPPEEPAEKASPCPQLSRTQAALGSREAGGG